ncbi:MAG: hypothetical protein KC468_33700 [Myxococcales bacterium]|nr:hypothetical protein [Myxococcales bacterium]
MKPPRRARASTLAAAAIAMSPALACQSSYADAGFPIIGLAVGADVTIELSDSRCDERPDQACLSSGLVRVTEVELLSSRDIELLDFGDDGEGLGRVRLRVEDAGETTMVVHYEDGGDEVLVDFFQLRAEEITRVEPVIGCAPGSRARERFPITAGVELAYDAVAYAGERPLAHGDLELVADFADFDVTGPGRARAPSAPGSRAWQLVGPESAPVEFVIYAPSAAEVALWPADEVPGVQVGQALDGDPVCLHEGDAGARVTVSGACAPVVRGVELVGAVPLNLGYGDVTLELSGQDRCAVSATHALGSQAAIELDIDNLPAPLEPQGGLQLGETPVEVEGELEPSDPCPIVTNLTNGSCEILDDEGHIVPDIDCALDWDWVVTHYDGRYSAPLEGPFFVGVGLTTLMVVEVSYQFLTIEFARHPPNHLVITASPDSVVADSYGCEPGAGQRVGVVASAPGDFNLNLSADNIYDAGVYSLRARAVAQAAFTSEHDVFAAPDEMIPSPTGPTVQYFPGAEARISVDYLDAGGASLVGVAPILASTDTPGAGASFRTFDLYTGTSPQTIRLASPAAPQALTVEVVDGDGIVDVSGLDDAQLSLGARRCLELTARGHDDAPIYGQSPTRPQLQLGGDALVVVAHAPEPGEEGADAFCLEADAAGDVTLDLSWGTATAQASWTVSE